MTNVIQLYNSNISPHIMWKIWDILCPYISITMINCNVLILYRILQIKVIKNTCNILLTMII